MSQLHHFSLPSFPKRGLPHRKARRTLDASSPVPFLVPVRTLIVGCGYVGTAVGQILAEKGHEVLGLRRSSSETSDLLQFGITPLTGDISAPASLQELPSPFDWIVNTVSSSRGGAEDYHRTYLTGTVNLLDWLKGKSTKKYVYTSSTSVYSQADGSEVTESSPAVPSSETTRLLLETENLLLEAARSENFPAVVLRLSGIYGPGRGHLFQQMLRGEATLAGDGSRLLNMIHRDDAASAIVAALQRGRPGEVYNVTDDFPVSQKEFLGFLADSLGRPMPGTSADAPLNRKRGMTSKRVSNLRLKSELGWTPAYPTYREGYAQEIARALGTVD